MDLISSVTTLDGSGRQAAKTSYGYDENNGSPQGVFGHRTSTNQWLNTTGGTVTVQKVYNSQGKVTKSIDALSNTTSITYDSSGIFPSQIQGPDTADVHHIDNFAYDTNTGELTSHTDQNGQITSYGYDNMRRLTSVTYPAGGGSKTYAYNDSTPNPQFTFTRSITPSLNLVKIGKVDGLGRMIQSRVTSDPAGTDYIDTTYDPLGRVATVSNPYRSTGDPTYGATQTQYDALGRVTKTTKQDNSVVTAQYNQTSTNSPNGDCTLTTDEAGNSRKACLDGLGRLIEVDEPQASSGSMTNPYVTLYSYDALGNVLSVNQKGDGSAAARVRNFTYDSLSRLLTATNPESGQISYSYDANGNVLQKTSPAPNQTGSATQTISYCYEALNRITGKAYSAQSCPLSSPVVTYSYDSGTNGIGHLTGLTDQAGSGSYSYDALGRIASEQRTIAGITKNLSYTYNLDNSVATVTYPSGAVVTYTPDAAGRALSVVDYGNNINYVTGSGGPNPASGATYGPDGSILSYNQGWTTSFDGIANTFSYNPRLQPVNMAAASPGTTGTSATASVSVSGAIAVGQFPPVATAAPGSALTSFYTGASSPEHLFFEDANGHIHEIYSDSIGAWQDQDNTAAANGTPATAHSSLTSFYTAGSYPEHLFFEAANGHIHEMYSDSTGAWHDQDNTAIANGTAAVSGSALTSFYGGAALEHVFFEDSNGHVHEMYSNWRDQDDTAGANGTPATAHSSLTSFYTGGSYPEHLFFEDADGHIHEMYSDSTGAWHDQDNTAIANGTAAVSGSALTSFYGGAAPEHVFFEDSSGHVHEMYSNWHDQDNAAEANLIYDSGTVSVSIGGFTATACFGNSTNSACTGQPVNSTPSQVATALAQALNASGSPVTATASGATVNMTWKATGPFTTPVSALSTTHDNPNLFPNPSFTSPATSFGGGTGANVPVFNITYNFNLGNGDNGNVIGITNNRDTTRSQSFTYDYLNRLTSAQNSGTNCNQMTVNGKMEYWGNSYGYDAWGNLLQKTVTKCSAENLSVSALSNNQLSGYGYDAAGNMTHDATTNLSYTFDAENRITGAAGYTYTYDTAGSRVEKSNGSTGTIYWYMSPGIVAESDLGGNLQSEYVFFDGERVARKDFSGNTTSVAYYFSDHLKTASVITNSAGVITEDEDYYPWGGELQFVNSDSNHYKFTGKERDSETQLDYFGARYYSNPLGRFITPDWSATPVPVPFADLSDPQSLNQYGYVRNIPTTGTDPNGHCEVDGEKHGVLWCIGHALGIKETKKEEKARLEAQAAAWAEWQASRVAYHNETGYWPEEVMGAGVAAYGGFYAGANGGYSVSEESAASPAVSEEEEEAAKLQPYEEEGGHHVPAKSAFRGAPGYDPNKALAIPNAELQRLGVSHVNVTGAQMQMYQAFSRTGATLTWKAVEIIETQALVRGGMGWSMAQQTVQSAIKSLQNAGVSAPTRIPWGGK